MFSACQAPAPKIPIEPQEAGEAAEWIVPLKVADSMKVFGGVRQTH